MTVLRCVDELVPRVIMITLRIALSGWAPSCAGGRWKCCDCGKVYAGDLWVLGGLFESKTLRGLSSASFRCIRWRSFVVFSQY